MHSQEITPAQHFCIEKSVTLRAYDMPGGHRHTWHELYYLLEGERRYFIDGQIYTVHEGDVILISKSTLHHTTSLSNRQHTRFLISFSDEFIHKSMQSEVEKCFAVRHFTLTEEARRGFEDILDKIITEYAAKSPFSDALFQAYTTEFLVMLIQHLQADKGTRIRTKTPTEQLIESATGYIQDNLQSNLTLSYVSDMYHLSQSYFSRIFRIYTGFGYNEYLKHLRIQKAAQLLLNTNMPISEIAYQCGFSDSNYFSTVFKKDAGISPIKYRMLRK